MLDAEFDGRITRLVAARIDRIALDLGRNRRLVTAVEFWRARFLGVTGRTGGARNALEFQVAQFIELGLFGGVGFCFRGFFGGEFLFLVGFGFLSLFFLDGELLLGFFLFLFLILYFLKSL